VNAGRPCQRGLRQFVISAVVAFLSSHPAPLCAQTADRLDAQSDAQDARNDALREPYDRTLEDRHAALEAAGVEFTNGDQPGERPRKQ